MTVKYKGIPVAGLNKVLNTKWCRNMDRMFMHIPRAIRCPVPGVRLEDDPDRHEDRNQICVEERRAEIIFPRYDEITRRAYDVWRVGASLKHNGLKYMETPAS